MITHYIIMSSSYSKGKRIALTYTIDGNSDYSELKDIIKIITKECGKDVSISTHFIQTDSKSWKSVVEKDYFFKDVEVIKNVDDFIKMIKADRVLQGVDVAKYILSKIRCTHLKLEKLVYLCYAEYLCKYNKELFQDKIYSYKYGPVVKSVYKKYKIYGYKEIEKEKEIETNVLELPAKSRILFAIDGVEKISSIEETLDKYGKYTAGELVYLTHQENTPWAICGKGKFNAKIIDNSIIKQYHCNEL